MTAAHSQAAAPTSSRIRLEQSLEQVLQSLLELGICASDVQESALESSNGQPGGLIGRKTSQTIQSFARLDSLKGSVGDILIPLDVISQVDQGRNPHLFTKDFIERLSGENMYTNGILSAVSGYRDLLVESMKDAFPDLAEFLDKQQSSSTSTTTSTTTATSTNQPQPTTMTTSTVPDETSSVQNGAASGNSYGNQTFQPPLNGQPQLPPQQSLYRVESGRGGDQNGTTLENGGDVRMEQDFR
ncbi:hypothetical protein JCM3765_003725 [Sporobolomyces pararoseus]